jgi:hypothetical protein
MSSKPTHLAFTVREYETGQGKKSRWLEIGAAWTHKDGKGFDIILEAVPVNGRMALRLNDPKTKPAAEGV